MRAQAVLLLWFGLPLPACAQELEPRSFVNVPIDQNFLAAGVIRSEGGLAPTPGIPLDETELTLETLVTGYVRSLDLGGKSGKFGITATRTCIEGSAVFQGEIIEGKRCGYGDLDASIGYNFYGAPSMTLAEFRQWQPGLVIGAGLNLLIPVGDYDSDLVINTGANRWMLRPSLGLSNSHGRFSYDVIFSIRIYGDNDDYFGGIYLEQDPVFQLQSHLIWSLPNGQWISLNANFFEGGETRQNEVARNDKQENSRWGLTYSLPINARHSLKFYANTGVVTRTGNDFDTLGLAWQYRFEN